MKNNPVISITREGENPLFYSSWTEFRKADPTHAMSIKTMWYQSKQNKAINACGVTVFKSRCNL